MERGWTPQGEGGKLKNWDPEIGDEPKPWIKHHLSFKQGLLVEKPFSLILLICVETAIDRTPSQVTDTIF